MKCHTVQDLLPLYAEQLTSDETAADIAAHLAKCGHCARLYAEMQSAPASYVSAPPEIKPLKQIRRRSRIAVSVTALLSAVIGVLAFLYGIYGIVPLNAEDISMEIALYSKSYDDAGQIRYSYENGSDVQAEERISIIFRGDCVGWRTNVSSNHWQHHSGKPDEIILSNENILLYRNLMPFCKPEMRIGLPLIDGYLITVPTKDDVYTYELTELARLAEANGGTVTVTVGTKLHP